MSLASRVALVTGSTSGIGLAIARALAREGAKIVLNGIGKASEAEEVRRDIETDFGVPAVYRSADLSRPNEVVSLVRSAEKVFERVDILVNNAGIQHVSPLETFPPEKWDSILAINMTAAFHAMRTAVPGMRARAWGRIVSTASAHSTVASPYKAAYVAAKHGLLGLTKTAALELATAGVTANCVSPGYVRTPLVEAQIPATMEARGMSREQVLQHVLLRAQPTGRFVESDQVAELVLFLCTDAAAQITGANLAMDGGWTAT